MYYNIIIGNFGTMWCIRKKYNHKEGTQVQEWSCGSITHLKLKNNNYVYHNLLGPARVIVNKQYNKKAIPTELYCIEGKGYIKEEFELMRLKNLYIYN